MVKYLLEYLLSYDEIQKLKTNPYIQLVEPIASKDSIPAIISMCLNFKARYNISPIGVLIYDTKHNQAIKRIYFNGEIKEGDEVSIDSEFDHYIISKDYIIPLPEEKCELIKINI